MISAIKIHRSTVFFLLFVALVILLANVPGQIVQIPPMDGNGQYGPEFYNMWEQCHHGFPFTFLVREPIELKVPPNYRFSLWRLNEGIVSFHGLQFAGDVVFGACAMIIAGLLFEKWRRRRNRLLQLHLIDLIILTTLAACVLSYWATNAKYRSRQEQVIAILHQKIIGDKDFGFAKWELGGPTWLRELIGDRIFSAFDRVVEIHLVDGEDIPKVIELKNLKAIELMGGLTKENLDALAELPELEALNLRFAGVDRDEAAESSEDPFTFPRFPRLRALNLYESGYAGAGLEKLENLEVLCLSGNDVFGDQGALNLQNLKKLRLLYLSYTNVTDAGLESLSKLDKLEELSLSFTKITDRGTRSLTALKNLKKLDLHSTGVTDRGLEQLKSLKKLQMLCLRDTAVTPQGKEQFRCLLPTCYVE
jgi:hypothetical protein